MRVTWLTIPKRIIQAIGFLSAVPGFITFIEKVREWWPYLNQLDASMLSELRRPFALLLAAIAFIIWAEAIARYIRKVCGVDGHSYLKRFKGLRWMVHISRANEVWVEDNPYCGRCKCQLKASNPGSRFDPLHYSCGSCGGKLDMWLGEVNHNREHVTSLVEKELRSWTRIFGFLYRTVKGLVVLTAITLISVGVLVQSWVAFLDKP